MRLRSELKLIYMLQFGIPSDVTKGKYQLISLYMSGSQNSSASQFLLSRYYG